MNWKWWFLVVSLDIFWAGLAFADKKEKEWPPMPPLDTLIGDTTGAITIRDSALIPTFGIYPVTGWGKVSYIDTNSFKKYGLIVFFDPRQEGCRDFVELFNEFKGKIENDWEFKLFLVAVRMAPVSCQPHEGERSNFWDCRTVLLSDFKDADSLKKLLVEKKWSYPVYRLKELLHVNLFMADTPPVIFIISAKEDYAVDFFALPPVFTEGKMGSLERIYLKLLFKYFFNAERKYLEKWKYVETKTLGDK